MGWPLIIYGLIFCCAFLCLQGVIGAGRQASTKIKLANSRLRQLEADDPHEEVLKKIRERRGLSSEGHIAKGNAWIKRLVLHSGLPLGSHAIYAIMGITALGLGAAVMIFTPLVWLVAIAIILGVVLPILVLKYVVKRRRNKAVTQLPEALDIIIRSLGAGHPVPVAMGLVGREMADPLGSEFGIASDEISFGANLGRAVQRLSDRIGHEDFELFAAMIRLQERTGGNLANLLRSNATTIRDRQRMRLKIRAASAEGRASAFILNAAPIGMFLVINVAAPDFYGEVIHTNLVKYGLCGVVLWMIIGNFVMRRMINFKI